MSKETILELDASVELGKVVTVDTGKVLISSSNAELLPRASIGKLVAIKGASPQEFLIATIDRVTRNLVESVMDIDPMAPTSVESTLVADDMVRAVVLGTFRTMDGLRQNSFKRGADNFPQIDREVYLIEGSNLQRFMSLLAAGLDENQRLELGKFALDPSAVAIANGDRFFQRHAAILGSTGSGKSCAVSLILERASARTFPNLIVFDMHGEYASLANPPPDKEGNPVAPIAKSLHIAGPGDIENPSDECIFLPYWLLNRDEMLSMILDRSDQNAPNQASRFTLHVKNLKEKILVTNKLDDVRSTFTVDSPIPYEISELVDELRTDDTAKGVGANNRPVKGEWEGRLTRFLSRLEAKLEDRRYGFMFQPPATALSYEWLAEQMSKLLNSDDDQFGIKIVDFSEVPSDILPVVAGVFARLLYDVQFWMEKEKRTPFVLVCDEAHLYLPVKEDADAVERQALHSFERIAKEGRKYGVSLLVVSQRPSDVSRTILSQCNNFLILRLTNDRDQSVVRRLMPDSLAGVLDSLPLLDVGEVFILGDSVLLPSRVKLNFPIIEPLSQTKDVWQEWGSNKPSMEAVQSAIEGLRKQSRK